MNLIIYGVKMKNKKFTAGLVLVILALYSNSSYSASSDVFGGASFIKDASHSYLGAVTAVNGDITTHGFLVRGSFGAGQYDYDNRNVAGGDVEANFGGADLLGGYQAIISDNQTLKVYLGASWEHHQLSPKDYNADVRGTEFGIKSQAEYYANLNEDISTSAIASYSTGFDTYFTSANVGYNFGNFSFGPELAFLGNEGFHQQRVGGNFGNIKIGDFTLNVNGGYAFASGVAEQSIFGGFNFTRRF